MNIQEIKRIQEESYDKWFERWYKKENLEETIKQSAMKGYSSLSYTINSKLRSDYENRRMNDKRFIGSLQEKLDGFTVYRKEPEKYKINLLGRTLTRYTDPEVVISWKGA